MHNELNDVSPSADATFAQGAARRRLLGAGVGGVVASLLPLLGGRASATTPPSGDTTPAPAPTTTEPPLRPTDDDVPLLVFAEGIELAARNLYDVGLANTELSDVERTVLATIRESHEAYANALSGLLGRQSDVTTNDDVIDQRTGEFSGSTAELLAGASDLESTLVATHIELLGGLQGVGGAKLVASILTTEARYGTVLADLAGDATLDDLLVTNKADALTPAEG